MSNNSNMALSSPAASTAPASTAAKRAKSDAQPLSGFQIALTGDCDEFAVDELKRMVRTLGGSVVADLSTADRAMGECVLVSETCRTTSKYLLALAKGIPCVSVEWLVEVRREKACVPYARHLLPAGTTNIVRRGNSGGSGSALRWTRHPVKQAVLPFHRCLRGVTVFVTSVDVHRKQLWERIVLALGGRLVDRKTFLRGPGVSDEFACQYVLFEDERAALAQHWALEHACLLGIPCVTQAWLIQCLIHYRVVPPSLHHSLRVAPPRL